jgi:hypothetical protein
VTFEVFRIDEYRGNHLSASHSVWSSACVPTFRENVLLPSGLMMRTAGCFETPVHIVTMAHAFSRAATYRGVRFRSRSTRGVCGGQVDSGKGFLPNTWVFP